MKYSRESSRDRREAPRRAAERATRGEIRELLVEAKALLRDGQKRLGRGERLEEYPARLASIAEEIDTKSHRLSGPVRLLPIGSRVGMVQACWMGVYGQDQVTRNFEALDRLADAVGADLEADLQAKIKDQLARGPMAEVEARRKLAAALDAAVDEFDGTIAWIDEQDKNA